MRQFRKRHSGRRLRAAIFVGVLVSALLALAAPSFADPGRPGLTRANQAVYPHAGEGSGVLGASGGGGAAGGLAVPGGEGLPFTGLSAALVLLAGLIALAIGLTLRMSSGRSTGVR
jgi:hypothetical protein